MYIRNRLLMSVLLVIFILSLSSSAFAKDFDDTTNHWAKKSINYVTNQEFFVGTSDNLFSPEQKMTRGMFAAVLSRIANADLSGYQSKVFNDVEPSAYYFGSINWAYNNKILSGIGNGNFEPDRNIKREEICLMLNNFIDVEKMNPAIRNKNTIKFTDDSEISKWSYSSVYRMYTYGYFIGDAKGNLNPTSDATRAECAVVFARLKGFFYSAHVSNNGGDLKSVDNQDLTYIGSFKMTYYCPSCNTPRGSRATSSGAVATEGRTVAVPRWVYNQYKGCQVYIENIGYRWIEDICGTEYFDIFCSGGCCIYDDMPYNGTTQKVYLVN